MKYILYNKDNEENKQHFNNCIKSIKQINDLKADVIYNSSFPRLKESKYRGIQAFKKLIKKHYEKENKKDYIKIMANMIKDEGFNKNDCIELFKLIFDSQEH